MTQLPTPDFDWIDAHAADDTSRLRLKYGKDHAFDILQIECRNRFGAKLRGLLDERPRLVFPTALSGEQSTSWPLALFHSSLISPGDAVVDLTSGLGADVMAMARVAREVTAVEINPEVAEALAHNALGLPVDVVNDDCRHFISQALAGAMHFDDAFIDPARRAADGSRKYALDQCEPDVVAMMPDLMRLADRIIIKASPMLDISHSLGLLPQTSRVIVLGTTTECKELDFIIETGADVESPEISAVTVLPYGSVETFDFSPAEESQARAVIATPVGAKYVLEPYPAVMKSGAMKLLSERYGISKAAANTHVWFGESVPDGFPGRAYKVVEVMPYASKNIKRFASKYPRIAVTARNFDMTADALRSKLGVKEGPGRLFAVSDARSNRWLIVTAE